jgi:hypothetical protein
MEFQNQEMSKSQFMSICRFLTTQNYKSLTMKNCTLMDSDTSDSGSDSDDSDTRNTRNTTERDTTTKTKTQTPFPVHTLEQINLDHCLLGPFLNHFSFSQLRSFSARRNLLTKQQLEPLFQQCVCIEELIVSQNPLGDEGMGLICDYISRYPQVHTLHVSYTGLTLKSVNRLLVLFEHGWTVRNLSIMNNLFGWKGVALLCHHLSFPMDQLILGHTHPQSDENTLDQSISHLLLQNTPIKALVLFGLQQCDSLLFSLQQHTLIQSMTLCACGPLEWTPERKQLLMGNESMTLFNVDATLQDLTWTEPWIQRNRRIQSEYCALVPSLLMDLRKVGLIPLPIELRDTLIEVLLKQVPQRDRVVLATLFRSRSWVPSTPSHHVYFDLVRFAHVYMYRKERPIMME